jgi:hypothetical protein
VPLALVALVEPTLMRMEPQALPGSAFSLAVAAVAVPHGQRVVTAAPEAAARAAPVLVALTPLPGPLPVAAVEEAVEGQVLAVMPVLPVVVAL